MPQIIPLVVTAITTVTSAVVAAGPWAVAAFNAVNVIGAGMLANAAFGALQPEVKSSSAAIEWNADPNAPNRFPFGRVGGAGNIIHNATYGPDKMFVSFVGVMGSSGPIRSWVGFRADDQFVSFDGSGKANSTQYANVMWLSRQLGRQPETSTLSSPSGLKNGATLPGWGSSYRLSGKAAFVYTLSENSKGSAYGRKVPTPINTIEGLYCYDPRYDSTYPGGTGSCRLNNPATWVYSTNAYIHALNWAIGRWEGLTAGAAGAPYASMKVGGIGASPEGIDFAAYVEAANVFDENRWACAAWPDADQSKAAVLDSFLQAGGGIYAERQGRISCVHRAAPRTSIVTITTDDTAGTIEYDTTTSLLERINTIRPKYWSEAHDWQMVETLQEVTSAVWREEDGQGVAVTKSKGVDFNYVPGSKQARELAALQIAHTREGIKGTAPLRHYLDLDVGDCFTWDVPEAVLNGLKCIVLNVDPDLENDIINVTFCSESDGKYPFAFGQTGSPPPAPALTPRDLTYVAPPLPGDWTVTPRPPAPGGGQLPGFDLGGIVSNETATAIIVEYGPSATGPWKQAYQGPPTVTNIPIDGVQPGGTYYIAVQYQREQNYSERYIYGPYTAPLLVSDDTTHLNGTPVEEITDRLVGAEELLDETRGRVDELTTVVESAESEFGQALILVGQKVEAAEDAARVSTGAATVATGAAGDALTYRGQTSELRNDAVAARDESRTAAQTANNAAASAVVQNAGATAAAAQAGISANLAAQVGASRPNLCPNGGFENGLTGIMTMPPGFYVSDDPTWGRNAQTNGSFANGTYAVVFPSFSVRPGTTYTVSGDTLFLATSGLVYLDIQFFRADGSLARDGGQKASGPHDYSDAVDRIQLHAFAEVAPADAVTARARCVWTITVGATSMGCRRIKVEQGNLPATVYSDEAGTLALNASLAFTASVAADAQTRLGQVVIETVGSSGGGGVFQFLMRAVGATSVGRMVASGLEFCNVIGGQVVKVMELIDGSVFITGVLVIGNRNAGRIEINGPGMRIDVFDDLNRLRGRFGKVS